MSVVVVDDDADTVKLVTLVLRREGARVRVAASAREALRRLDESWPALLLTDLGMPNGDGYELLRSVRQICEARRLVLPVIAFTAHDGEAEQLRASRAGFAAHLPKPIRPGSLVRRIAEYCRPSNASEPCRAAS